ncbi:MAG: formate hydrogenlyase transcriptional activator [Bryobacterales bacterium]|jgi:formate hydrogenlyase transcriptional activator|nr:formate hydrogenlyase transcriptional activator [Bryobacterales bacterium]
MVGESPKLQNVLRQANIVGPTDSTVLIYGETGTGKDLMARMIHEISARHEHPLVKMNCAAIPLGLLESELFGHERGAFTGAIAQRIGRFEMANRGTLFLDEIGDIPPELQPKLLRVLQEHEFERLGSAHTIHVDIRLIAATNRNLAKMVEEGKFRADLFYRLNVFPLTVPPLRERPGDIAPLIQHFVRLFAERMNRRIDVVPDETVDRLTRHSWTGNIRELENFIERSVILTRGSVLEAPLDGLPIAADSGETPVKLKDAERAHIARILQESDGVITAAAALLGIPRSTLFYKMRRLGIAARRPAKAGTAGFTLRPVLTRSSARGAPCIGTT